LQLAYDIESRMTVAGTTSHCGKNPATAGEHRFAEAIRSVSRRAEGEEKSPRASCTRA